MKPMHLVPIVFVVTLVALIMIAYNLRQQPPVSKTQLTHQVLVVDLNDNGLFTAETLSKGEDALLVLDSKANRAATEGWMSSLEALQNYDLNKDKRIDQKDPIFSKLGLMFFPGDPHKQKFVALETMGIKAIVFDPNHLKSQEAKIVAGYVVLKDGSKRKINVIVVDY